MGKQTKADFGTSRYVPPAPCVNSASPIPTSIAAPADTRARPTPSCVGTPSPAATRSNVAPPAHPSLPKGQACAPCRQKKTRCDGVKPACYKCKKYPQICIYPDGPTMTRAQRAEAENCILRQRLSLLEQRLQESDCTAPSTSTARARTTLWSASSSFDSLGGMAESASSLPLTSRHPHQLEQPPEQILTLEDVLPFSLTSSDLSLESAQRYLDEFEPFRRQCGLDINMELLKDSLHSGMAQQLHSALLNAIFVWGCFLSNPKSFVSGQQDPPFLARAENACREELRHSSRVVETMQALWLLAVYFLSTGRLSEAAFYASGGARLAMPGDPSYDLSADAYSDSGPPDQFNLGSPGQFSEAEKISVFWMMYNLDKCWAVRFGTQSVFPDALVQSIGINVPWPQDVTEYGCSLSALRITASSVFERAHRLSRARLPDSALEEQFHMLQSKILELTLDHPLTATTLANPDDKAALVAIHSLTRAATIHLNRRWSQHDLNAWNMVQAARECVSVAHLAIAEHSTRRHDVWFVDPILDLCWRCAADVLLDELHMPRTQTDPTEIREELETLLFAMDSLSERCPLLSKYAAKIRAKYAPVVGQEPLAQLLLPLSSLSLALSSPLYKTVDGWMQGISGDIAN